MINSRYTYFWINLLLLIAFLGLVVWLYFTPEDLSCVYAEKGLTCPTCGLTRAFRAIITFDSTVKINPLHMKIVFFFLIQLLMRLVVTVWSFYKIPTRRLITTDIAVSVMLFIVAFYPLFPFVG